MKKVILQYKENENFEKIHFKLETWKLQNGNGNCSHLFMKFSALYASMIDALNMLVPIVKVDHESSSLSSDTVYLGTFEAHSCFVIRTRTVGDHREYSSWTCSYMARYESFLCMPPRLRGRIHCIIHGHHVYTHFVVCEKESHLFEKFCTENTDARLSIGMHLNIHFVRTENRQSKMIFLKRQSISKLWLHLGRRY